MGGIRRTPEEKIEDAFFDLHPQRQVRMLATLKTLHRMKMRTVDQMKIPADTENQQGSLVDRSGAETGTSQELLLREPQP